MAAKRAPRRLSRCHTIEDLRDLCRRRLPAAPFGYIDGGAEEEVTLERNRQAFGEYAFRPRTLVDVSQVDLSTEILGQPLALPLILAPCGFARLADPRGGETAAARAAHRAGTVSVLSSMASSTIEQVAEASDGPLWYQLYVWRDRGILRDFIDRARESGYRALCLTVDVPVFGQRERDLRTGMTIPPSLTLRTLMNVARHPRWIWEYLSGPRITVANVAKYAPGGRTGVSALGSYVNQQFDPTLNWRDLEWMLAEWNGPFAVKGVLRPEDAVRAVEMGVSAIVVSNHGGRQLDHSPAPIQVLREIAAAVDGRADIVLDGGVRRGTDVAKALALGARACMIGRPYLYGLGAGGERGAERAIEILRSETERALALLGCPSARELDPSYLQPNSR